jgi:hypothetical protein
MQCRSRSNCTNSSENGRNDCTNSLKIYLFYVVNPTTGSTVANIRYWAGDLFSNVLWWAEMKGRAVLGIGLTSVRRYSPSVNMCRSRAPNDGERAGPVGHIFRTPCHAKYSRSFDLNRGSADPYPGSYRAPFRKRGTTEAVEGPDWRSLFSGKVGFLGRFFWRVLWREGSDPDGSGYFVRAGFFKKILRRFFLRKNSEKFLPGHGGSGKIFCVICLSCLKSLRSGCAGLVSRPGGRPFR